MRQLAETCVCLSGIKNADENELRSIASEPEQIHMYNVRDFSFLLDIVDDVTSNLCNSVKGPGRTVRPAPRRLEQPIPLAGCYDGPPF